MMCTDDKCTPTCQYKCEYLKNYYLFDFSVEFI
jgi:hypothetical protein